MNDISYSVHDSNKETGKERGVITEEEEERGEIFLQSP